MHTKNQSHSLVRRDRIAAIKMLFAAKVITMMKTLTGGWGGGCGVQTDMPRDGNGRGAVPGTPGRGGRGRNTAPGPKIELGHVRRDEG